jgi:hypothetical protein
MMWFSLVRAKRNQASEAREYLLSVEHPSKLVLLALLEVCIASTDIRYLRGLDFSLLLSINDLVLPIATILLSFFPPHEEQARTMEIGT